MWLYLQDIANIKSFPIFKISNFFSKLSVTIMHNVAIFFYGFWGKTDFNKRVLPSLLGLQTLRNNI